MVAAGRGRCRGSVHNWQPVKKVPSPGWSANRAPTSWEVKNWYAEVLKKKVPREAACSTAVAAYTWEGLETRGEGGAGLSEASAQNCSWAAALDMTAAEPRSRADLAFHHFCDLIQESPARSLAEKRNLWCRLAARLLSGQYGPGGTPWSSTLARAATWLLGALLIT